MDVKLFKRLLKYLTRFRIEIIDEITLFIITTCLDRLLMDI